LGHGDCDRGVVAVHLDTEEVAHFICVSDFECASNVVDDGVDVSLGGSGDDDIICVDDDDRLTIP
jgi:hypothetical protein